MTLRVITETDPPTVEDAAYVDLPIDVVRFFADEGDPGAIAFLAAHGAKYSPDQPRDWHGRFGSGGGDAVAQELGATTVEPVRLNVSLPTTTRELRDQLVDGWRDRFNSELSPGYVQRLDAAIARGERPGSGMSFSTKDYTNSEQMVFRERMDKLAGREPDDFRRYESAMVRAFVDDDRRALGVIRANGTKQAAGYFADEVRPEFVDRASEAIRSFNEDPRAQALMERYGAPRIMVAATERGLPLDSLDAPSGSYASWEGGPLGRIALFDNAWYRSGPKPTLQDVEGPLQPGGATVSGGTLRGVLTHEFGHFVESRLTDEQRSEWQAIQGERKRAYDAEPDRFLTGERTISYYAMTDNGTQVGFEREAFGETFAAVMHPDYNRNDFDPSNHAMLDFMQRIVDEAKR